MKAITTIHRRQIRSLYQNFAVFILAKVLSFLVFFHLLYLQIIYSFMDLQKFAYPACPIAEHAQEPLSRICLDQKCDARAPVCCICEYESHKGHNTVPIKQIVKQICESNHTISPLDAQAKVSALRKQYFDSLNRCKKQILDEISQLQVKGELYFNRCEETILGFYSLSQPLSAELQTDAKLYKRYFSKLLMLIPTQDKKNFSLGQKVKTLINNFQNHHKQMCQQIRKIENELKKNIQPISQLLGDTMRPVPGLGSIKWSEVLKGTKIKITEATAQQTGMESSGQRFALIQEALPLNAKSQWGIKVKKFVGWVGVGICLKNCIKNANYHFNYTNIGHGSYLMSTNGYTWSHSVKQFNSAFKTFQFTTNDTVYIQYDPIGLKLRFRKNNGAEKFELDIVPPPAGDSYHPCVNLCSTGDAIELIYPGIPLS